VKGEEHGEGGALGESVEGGREELTEEMGGGRRRGVEEGAKSGRLPAGGGELWSAGSEGSVEKGEWG